MSVERMAWKDLLTDLEELPAGVGAARATPAPTPTPAPLPELEPGEYYAVVSLQTAGSALNVREQPTTSARILDKLDNGRRLIVSGEADADGWVPVRTAELSGYVKLEYLKRQ